MSYNLWFVVQVVSFLAGRYGYRVPVQSRKMRLRLVSAKQPRDVSRLE